MVEQAVEWVRGVDAWDGERPLGIVDIRIERTGQDGVIAEVRDAEGPPGGLAAIPGLIDTHVHLGAESTRRPVDFLTWPLTTRPEERVLHMLANARRAMAAGVTTLRDLAADDLQFSLRRALDAGVVEGARILAYGLVGRTGGHADLFVPPAALPRPPLADGPDECRRLVRRFVRDGADGIKITTSGGVLSVGDRAAQRGQTAAEIDATVDEAHALGVPVAAHAHTESGVQAALDGGVDSIEHGTLITREQADDCVRRGVTLAPTLLINDRIAGGRGSAEQAEKAGELVTQRDERLRAAAAAGVDVVLGTDANGFHVEFGDQWLELAAMAALFGWSAERALAAATSRAAAAVRRTDLGRIAVGAKADLVLTRGRPWHDLAVLDPARIDAVLSRGRVVAGSIV